MANQRSSAGGQGPMIQELGAHWQLAGSLRPVGGGHPFSSVNRMLRGSGSVIVVRNIDVLSPHILAAKTTQCVVPTVTVTTPSGGTVTLGNARIANKTDRQGREKIQFTYQEIASDDWEIVADDWERVADDWEIAADDWE